MHYADTGKSRTVLTVTREAMKTKGRTAVMVYTTATFAASYVRETWPPHPVSTRGRQRQSVLMLPLKQTKEGSLQTDPNFDL